jgi:phosphatidylserine decarboxylase
VAVASVVAAVLAGLVAAALPVGMWARVGITWAVAFAAEVAFLAWRFYRDPERTAPDRDDAIVSPADGEVVYVRRSTGGMLPVAEKHGHSFPLIELTKTPLASEEAIVVGIGMSFLDVHINRAPIAGKVTTRKHFPGQFGSLGKAEMVFRNERATTVIERDGLQVAMVQIASRLVRQIVSFVKEGQNVALGQRVGVIRLGSQVDVVIPARSDLRVAVKAGDRVKAGVSVLALLESAVGQSDDAVAGGRSDDSPALAGTV